MTDIQCDYSGMEVAAHIDPSLPTECPKCGAIRLVPARNFWPDVTKHSMFRYPHHKQADFVRMRDRNRLVGGEWKVVEENEQ